MLPRGGGYGFAMEIGGWATLLGVFVAVIAASIAVREARAAEQSLSEAKRQTEIAEAAAQESARQTAIAEAAAQDSARQTDAAKRSADAAEESNRLAGANVTLVADCVDSASDQYVLHNTGNRDATHVWVRRQYAQEDEWRGRNVIIPPNGESPTFIAEYPHWPLSVYFAEAPGFARIERPPEDLSEAVYIH